MNKVFFILIFLFSIIIRPAFCQDIYYVPEEYKAELLREAKKCEDDFFKYQNMEGKYKLLPEANKYKSLYSSLSSSDPVNGLAGGYVYLKYLNILEDFFTEGDEFEQYKYLVVAIRLYTEYYEITKDKEIANHITDLHKIQKKNKLVPYIHYGFYRDDIFDFNIATPSFDYFENLSLSCFQIEVTNNSTNPIDFRRFAFSIHMLDGKVLEEIDLEKNQEFYNSLPPMPDGYIFEIIPIRGSDRALKLFPVIKDESKIEKVVMNDKKSNFKIEAIFFENIKK